MITFASMKLHQRCHHTRSELETGKETDSTMYKEGFPNDHNDTVTS